jgi:hypothetical protein
MASIRTIQVGQYIEIKKIAQIYGNNSAMQFLTTHTNSPYGSYPKEEDPNRILTKGMKVQVIGKGKSQTKYRESYITVIDNRKNTFDVMSSDLRKFFK